MATHRADRRRSNDGLDWFSGGLKGVSMEFTTASEVRAHNRAILARRAAAKSQPVKIKISETAPKPQAIEIKYGNPGDAAVTGAYYGDVPQTIPAPYTGSHLPKFRHIRRVVADYYEINEILSDRRTAGIVRPRHVYFYLAHILTKRSYNEIAREIGKHHTSIMHGDRKMVAMIKADHPIKDEIEEIRERVMSRVVSFFMEQSKTGVEILAA
jgi:hypothetical protein